MQNQDDFDIEDSFKPSNEAQRLSKRTRLPRTAMTWNSGEKKFLEELEQGHGLLVLTSLSIMVGEITWPGQGRLRRVNDRFLLTARYEQGSLPAGFGQSHWEEMQLPRLNSCDEFLSIKATTFAGLRFEGAVAPPHRWTDRPDGVTEFDCALDQISLEGETNNDLLIAAYLALQSVDFTPNPEFSVPLESLDSAPTRFHAILPGVKSILAEHRTRIERHSAFLPVVSSEKLDTYFDEDDERRIGLVEEEDGLHVHLELLGGDRSEEEDEAIFSALLDAAAFTHGCQPHPNFKEYHRAGRVSRVITAVTALPVATIKPAANPADARAMFTVAFEYFRGHGAIVARIRKTMSLYRDAAQENVPLPIQVLTVCTLLEGLTQSLFDAHGLKDPTAASDDSTAFKTAKEATIKCLRDQHTRRGHVDGSESPWSRFAGYLQGCGYVRPRERLTAIAGCFGLPWEGDVEEIFRIWNRHRNGLAHGAEVKSDLNSIRELFQAWSRLSGAFYRFILAEMGYVGPFCYSPMEPGLESLHLDAKP